ncbi:hypothetical protein E4U42_003272 [Claviceps africana]|uniref:Carboxylic ester hydrolase n=1 Tax=Claviceps africana TaxID=83212 RepID=A0A8K0NIZ4_9HYPO|nr:hypothetical protein E4U42_003272 [Claviceps africana]
MVRSLTFASFLSLVGLAVGGSLHHSHSQKPTVRVKNGTYQGVFSPGYQQDFFLGMPYAKKAQRFTPPQHLEEAWDATRLAESYPPHCQGVGIENRGYNMSEDCLYLNVVRPHGLAPDAKLPVAVWIHGGALINGGSAERRFNLSFIVQKSVQMKKPIIGVSLNYRLSAFGFLGSKEALHAGATNIGFRDQRLALQWVNENIDAFGGSPDKVTIWGESSGAESVTAQVFAYNGQHDGLFRAAIGQSGFGGILPRLNGGFNATAHHQANFDDLVRSIPSCASLVGSPAALDCLRSADLQQLDQSLAKMYPYGWPPVLDGTFLLDHGANQIAQGKFARVPILVGTNSDEGSAFGSRLGVVNTDDDFRRAVISSISPTAPQNLNKSLDEILDEALHLYPNIQPLGVPSLATWPHVLQSGDDFAKEFGLQFRRRNAFIGDMLFLYFRRRANLAWSRYGIPSFAYCFDVTVNGMPPMLGATHFQEVAFVFHNIDGVGYEANPFGGNAPDYSAKARALADTMCAQWINFIVDLDPNGDAPAANAAWPVFALQDGDGVGTNLVFGLDGPSVERDDVRAAGVNWFIENDLGLVGN